LLPGPFQRIGNSGDSVCSGIAAASATRHTAVYVKDIGVPITKKLRPSAAQQQLVLIASIRLGSVNYFPGFNPAAVA